KTKGHKAQIGTYELLYEHTTGDAITAPAEIIGLKTKGKPEAAVGEIVGARQMMAGSESHRGLIDYAADMFRSGLFPPNPQSPLCSPKYCPRWRTCPYHE
ncbi:PD-(D/E)XK nuclease family protein, partial [Pseudomonas aeruginosa]